MSHQLNALSSTTLDSSASPNATTRSRHGWWSLRLILVLLFVQVWRDIGGFTFRLEDLLTLSMVGLWVLTSFKGGVFRYRRSGLNLPLTIWIGVIVMAVGVSFMRPHAPDVKQDALVNGIRLMLALSLFFVVNNHPLAARRKGKIVFDTIVLTSLLTSAVALLQIAHWAGWLPFSLPSVLTTFKEGVNTERGREIFALFIGNNGAHTWSAMLAFQALTVWILATTTRVTKWRLAGLSYFLLLSTILIRISVRNSILGLLVAIVLLSLLRARKSRYRLNRLIMPLLILSGMAGLIGLLLFAGPEQYFVQRLVQTIPQVSEGGGLVIDSRSNIFGRLDYIVAALKTFTRFPVFGGGFYGFRTYYFEMTGNPTISHAHNSYAQILAELGLIGAIVFIWVAWRVFSVLVTVGRDVGWQSLWERRVWYLTVSVFTFIAFTAFFANPLWDPTLISFSMILLAVMNRYFWQRDTRQGTA